MKTIYNNFLIFSKVLCKLENERVVFELLKYLNLFSFLFLRRFQTPDGQVFTVTYVADENGVRATGDHLPVDHPKPAHALAQIAAAENQ